MLMKKIIIRCSCFLMQRYCVFLPPPSYWLISSSTCCDTTPFFGQKRLSPSFFVRIHSSHHYIEYHHQDETDGEADGAEVRVLTAGGFGNEFFDNDIEHRSCSKGEHVG